MRRINFRQVLVYGSIVLAAGMYIFISWAGNAAPASEIAMQALESDVQVLVKEENGLISFKPADAEPTIGFIFYPGGRVDYRAYAPVLKMIAARGYFVALVPAPLNLAFFNTNAANQVMDLFPDIQQWVVGGHSLGGVTASSYASQHLDKLDGIIFWASYPSDNSLKNTSFKALLVFGTNDMAGSTPYTDATLLGKFPADTQIVSIEGGNHAQFGSYGPQAGDKPATISPEEQWAQIADATATFLESLVE